MRVAFMFGAGAEAGKGNFNLPTGNDYFTNTVYNPKVEYFNALSKFFNKEYFDKCKYSRHQVYNKNYSNQQILRDMTLLYIEQTCQLGELNEMEIKKIVKRIAFVLTQENQNELDSIDILKDYLKNLESANNSQAKKKSYEILVANAVDELSCILERKRDFIPQNFLIQQLTNILDGSYVLKYPITSAGFFERYFHTIIDPSKYSTQNFMKIFNYYWSCFFYILDNYLTILKEKSNGFSTFCIKYNLIDRENNVIHINILRNLPDVIEFLSNIEVEAVSETSYYNLISEAILKYTRFQCAGVLTTNYLKLPQIVCSRTAYLNGAMHLFEFPEYLEVKDLSKEKTVTNESIFFPFIFGQSMLKPIVHNIQIHNFYEAYHILEDADILVIIGYNINEDDNHINTLFHDFVDVKKKKLFFVTNNNNYDLTNRLRLKKNKHLAEIINVDYGKGTKTVIDEVFRILSVAYENE